MDTLYHKEPYEEIQEVAECTHGITLLIFYATTRLRQMQKFTTC